MAEICCCAGRPCYYCSTAGGTESREFAQCATTTPEAAERAFAEMGDED